MLPAAFGSQKQLTTTEALPAVKWKIQISQAALRCSTQAEGLKSLAERKNTHTRSLLDVEVLKSALLKQQEDGGKKCKKEKLPPLLTKSGEVNYMGVMRQEKQLMFRSVKEAMSNSKGKETLEPITIAGKGVAYRPTVSPKQRIRPYFGLVKQLKVTEKDARHRSKSIDLRRSNPSLLNVTFESGIFATIANDSDQKEVLTVKDSAPVVVSEAIIEKRICSCVSPRDSFNYKLNFTTSATFPALKALQTIYVNRDSDNDKRQSVAFYFEGVLGDFYKRCLNDTSPKSMRLRKHCLVGLQWLQQSFKLVLVTSLSHSKVLRVLTYFRTRHISFKAAYTAASKTVDYSPVLSDLQITWQDLLVVSSIDLAYEDLEEISERSLYVKAGSKLRVVANAVPVSEGNTPVVLLVPSLVSQHSADWLPFDIVAGAIQYFRKSYHWTEDFSRVHTAPVPEMASISTSIIHEIALNDLLPPPQVASLRCSTLCSLHSTPLLTPAPALSLSRVLVLGQRPAVYGAKGGCDIVETKALRLKSGFLNLLDYTSVSSPRPKPALTLGENI